MICDTIIHCGGKVEGFPDRGINRGLMYMLLRILEFTFDIPALLMLANGLLLHFSYASLNEGA